MERRNFSRILFSAAVEIRQGSQVWQSELLDLSLKGALVRRPDDYANDDAAPMFLAIRIEGLPNTIMLQGHIAHSDESTLGVESDLMDIDSASKLRRLIEMNLGDDKILHREFSALIDAHKHAPITGTHS